MTIPKPHFLQMDTLRGDGTKVGERFVDAGEICHAVSDEHECRVSLRNGDTFTVTSEDYHRAVKVLIAQ